MKLPAITWNFTFANARKNDSIESATGVIYLDWDCESEQAALELKERLKLNKKCVAVWLSVSGLGCGSLFESTHYDLPSYHEQIRAYEDQFGVSFDTNASKATQCNVLSYDADCWWRDGELIPIVVTEQLRVALRLSSQLDHYEEECVFIPKGREFVRAFWPFSAKGQPKTVSSGNRYRTMSAFINNLVWLNSTAESDSIFALASNFGTFHCSPPMSSEEIVKIIRSKFAELKKGTLVPINPTIKRYWVDPSSKDKMKAFQSARRSLIQCRLEEWFSDELLNKDQKVTCSTIAKDLNVSLPSIKRNLTEEMKESMKAFNEQFVSATTKYRIKKLSSLPKSIIK